MLRNNFSIFTLSQTNKVNKMKNAENIVEYNIV